MKNQPNDMVTFEWLLPLFNQQLSQVADGWQLGEKSADYEQMSHSYHQVSGALTMLNLPALASLATKLSLLAGVVNVVDIEDALVDDIAINSETESETAPEVAFGTDESRIGQMANRLLMRELGHYARTGSCHTALLNKTSAELTQVLTHYGVVTDHLTDAPLASEADYSASMVDAEYLDITVPDVKAMDNLDREQYQQLLLVWRQQVQVLLAANANTPSILTVLEKVSQYLWQTAADADLQRLWYLTETWMHDLAYNETPKPKHYAALLSQLDALIESCAQQNEISTSIINNLIASIYIELSNLVNHSENSQSILHNISQPDVESRFLPRILNQIEALIFNLDKPHTLLKPLQQINNQLESRGWTLFAVQTSSILDDIERGLSAEAGLTQEQWQIERQLQELYDAIYNTEQVIASKIGNVASFTSKAAVVTNDDFDGLNSVDGLQTDNDRQINASDKELRELRIAVEDVKQGFNDYIQRQHTDLLSESADFTKISEAFDSMGLPSIRYATDKIADIFDQLNTHEVNVLSWDVTEAVAEGLTSIELLLDYLAQQVFNQPLLEQANAYIDKASTLLTGYIDAPETVKDTFLTQKLAASNVLRYDDSGEIAPIINDDDIIDSVLESDMASDNLNHFNSSDKTESAALLNARSQIKPDNFDIDEDIRDIFIEEVAEVIADLEDFLPIWQQDAQDLTPLTEVRRGFHTLKGSGRMVGAFSISEMAWSIENLLNRLLDKTLPVTDEVVALVTETTQRLPAMLSDFEAQQLPSFDPAITIVQSNNLMSQQPINTGLETSKITSSTADVEGNYPLLEESLSSNETSLDIEHADTAGTTEHVNYTMAEEKAISASLIELEIPAVLQAFVSAAQPLPIDADDADPDIKEIFLEEANEVLDEIVPLYEQWQLTPDDLTQLTDIRRGFHTLKGSGRMVGANTSAELAWSIENMLNRILDNSITASTNIQQLISHVLSVYPELLTTFENGSQDYPTIMPLWVACAQAYSKQLGNEFSYPALYQQLVGTPAPSSAPITNQSAQDGSTNESNTEDSTDENTDNSDHIDSMLQKINSVNEKMAEAPIVLAPQSEEEQAFFDIFIEEAEELLESVNDFVRRHQDEPYVAVSDEIVRAFHTLRAASGSSALTAISEVSATIEQSLELLQQQDTPMSAQHLKALAQSATLINGYLDNYKQNIQQQDVSLEETQSQQDIASLQAMLGEQYAIKDNESTADNKPTINQLLDDNINELLDAEWQLETALTHSENEQVETYIAQQIAQIKYLSGKAQEFPKFTAILNELGNAYAYLSHHPEQSVDTDIQAILLAGHAQLVGLFDALAGSSSLKIDEQVLQQLRSISQRYDNNDQIVADDAAISAETETDINIAAEAYADALVHSIAAPELELETIDTDIELLEIFLEEAQELDDALNDSFSKWRADISNINTLKVLQRHLHTIKGGARMAGIRSIGDLTHEAESIYEAFVEERRVPTAQWLEIMQVVQDTLSLQVAHIVRYQQSFFAPELIEQLQQFEKAKTLPDVVQLIVPMPKNHIDTESQVLADEYIHRIEQAADSLSLDRIIKQSWANGLPDPDILEVFLEEAEALTNRNEYLQSFLSDANDTVALQALQRDLHTLKGGARMVTASGIADLAHEMESVYTDFVDRRRPATKKVLELLVACHDWLADAVFILSQQVNPPTPDLLIEALQQFSKNPDSLKHIPKESLQAQRDAILLAKQKQESTYIQKDISEMPLMVANTAEQEQNTNNNEMIRISGGLIEHMINLSGESAINRARIDMGMSSLTNSIEEMGTTVQRLADQLRRMEIELEAQILSQIDDELVNHEGFDPLEMDQYSSLNQLSKSLTESASDLVDINNTLLEKTRDSESLLLQLSRTQTELQDGLMNSRMVPFTRLTPRLERIVRQTANELNKSVELKIINADDEMDRTILERITSPLEHMLRNAVDHGIENVATRQKAGKERSGQITLEVLREGSEIVIQLTDDGRGIDVEAVRNKAISQGLIDADDSTLSDLDIMQYIFNAGLSTSKQVTQISGRGVGMDVVISEVRQLGGAVSVVSELGKGSRFTMRVPLTVAVSDALVVRAADRYYAIPLVQIERVVRINPEKVYDYYQSGAATLNFEDTDYRVRYLNEILSGNKLNELVVNTNTSVPLIIIKNRSGQNMALQVDQIAGSRIEVVVKPLGQQFSNLSGISAATIMGDGSVMLILDLIALMRNVTLVKEFTKPAVTMDSTTESRATVLVVDDSVTVRKVTSRFLERQGFNVVLAKDGIDALEILQETTPDLMLLDIEMPRMDGFEVATQVRHNRRLQHLPIIMITSRTGEKHRERALEIGVNDYMGKPFQENQLLSKIEALLGKEASLVNEG
ncbi:chemosensory pili system protein ChpA (sensor histidine kinase/response regulator) [Psychrobacter luti]|uniref:Chemotaxis protein CheA n=1 Tax=Psychrobacter luti TaxID=198481 RepID=A0A839TCT1_9GAMM|nr:Hpt domain-containing protein [Psychrobacter luti]MBB3106978.1 chemosensory pili system protein ChpA (sensor histidine kinase/response regulator) [Psychrobacter luti]